MSATFCKDLRFGGGTRLGARILKCVRYTVALK